MEKIQLQKNEEKKINKVINLIHSNGNSKLVAFYFDNFYLQQIMISMKMKGNFENGQNDEYKMLKLNFIFMAHD